jgi:hypothetical protein
MLIRLAAFRSDLRCPLTPYEAARAALVIGGMEHVLIVAGTVHQLRIVA